MSDNEPRAILSLAPRLIREPRRETRGGGRKSTGTVVHSRLAAQRNFLAEEFLELSRSVAEQPSFSGHVALRVTMHDDSTAPSYAPRNIFRSVNGAELMAPYHAGCIVQVRADLLETLAERVIHTDLTKEKADISRIRRVRFFGTSDATGGRSAESLWNQAPQTETGRIFYAWFLCFPNDDAAEDLIQKIIHVRDSGYALSPPSIFETPVVEEDNASEDMHLGSIESVSGIDQMPMALQEYRRRKDTCMELVVPSRNDLERILALGVIIRIDPGSRITCSRQSYGKCGSMVRSQGLSGHSASSSDSEAASRSRADGRSAVARRQAGRAA